MPSFISPLLPRDDSPSSGPTNPDLTGIGRILVIKLRAIGDVLLSTIVLSDLRRAFPRARIDFLTEKAAAPLLQGHPMLDSVRVFDPASRGSLPFLIDLRRSGYDLVIDLFCNPRSAFMTYATGSRHRVGYPFRGRKYAYTLHVPIRSAEVHNTEFNLDALRRIGIPVTEKRIALPVTAEARQAAASFLGPSRASGKMIVALNPSGTWETKRWGLEHFALLADALATRYDAVPVLIWGPGEEPDVYRIREMMQQSPLIAPPTSLIELAALFSLCDYTISNDSGPMHISAVTGVPTLGIFGPTNPLLQGPYNDRSTTVRLDGLSCLACNLTRCPIGNTCMTNLTVEHVLGAFESLLKNHPVGSRPR